MIRSNPMFVINSNDKIEYVAADPKMVKSELEKLFFDVDLLLKSDLNPYEVFYYAALLHLLFVKKQPFQDGNGRTARLIEKWFLLEKLGQKAAPPCSLKKTISKRLRIIMQISEKSELNMKIWIIQKVLTFC